LSGTYPTVDLNAEMFSLFTKYGKNSKNNNNVETLGCSFNQEVQIRKTERADY
jgi:hypothetical protein